MSFSDPYWGIRPAKKPPAWITAAEALIEVLGVSPDEVPDEESLEVWLANEVRKAIGAAGVPRVVPTTQHPHFPKILEDVPIVAWLKPKDLATLINVAERSLLRWERKGLTVFGRGKSKRYPVPHSLSWCRAYQRRRKLGGEVVEFLHIAIAFEQNDYTDAMVSHDSDNELRW